eukprot:2754415-Rhodomonas_salina.1
MHGCSGSHSVGSASGAVNSSPPNFRVAAAAAGTPMTPAPNSASCASTPGTAPLNQHSLASPLGRVTLDGDKENLIKWANDSTGTPVEG